jgi:hypothetical protein
VSSHAPQQFVGLLEQQVLEQSSHVVDEQVSSHG